MNILTEDQSVHFEKSQNALSHTYKRDTEFCGKTQRMSYQLLLSTASPNPGVSTIVSSN